METMRTKQLAGFVSFEYRRTPHGEMFYTKAAEHDTREDAIYFRNVQNCNNANPKRGYAWAAKVDAPEDAERLADLGGA